MGSTSGLGYTTKLAAGAGWIGFRRSISLAYPIVQTLFERGAFGPASMALCASLIPFACVPLVMISYNTVLTRAWAWASSPLRPA